MDSIQQIAGWLAGGFSLIAFAPYIISIVVGRTRPQRVSWWIWTLVGFLLLGSYHSNGAATTIWVPVVYALVPLVVAILSLRFGVGGRTTLDYVCLTGAGLAVLLWLILRSPIAVLICLLITDLLAVLPTLRNCRLNPQQENRLAWGLMCLGSMLNLVAVDCWSFRIAAYPAYMFTMNSMIFLLLLVSRRASLNRGPQGVSCGSSI